MRRHLMSHEHRCLLSTHAHWSLSLLCSFEWNQWSPTERAWAEEQKRLRTRLITTDALGFAWPPTGSMSAAAASAAANTDASVASLPPLTLIGGLDISFVTGSDEACVALVVCAYPPPHGSGEMRVLYESFEMVTMVEPYIPGFLAFREVGFLLRMLEQLRASRPELVPQLLFIDGNGILHPRGFGIASHLGVLADIPTIGVAKNLHMVDGLERDAVHAQATGSLRRGGDSFPLVGRSGTVWGACLRSTDASSNPIFVSIGHRICLDTATAIVHSCCQHRIPTPVRHADLKSRDCIRQWKTARPAPPAPQPAAGASAAPVVAPAACRADEDAVARVADAASSTPSPHTREAQPQNERGQDLPTVAASSSSS